MDFLYLLSFMLHCEREKRDHAVRFSDNAFKIKMGYFILIMLCVSLSSCNFVRFFKKCHNIKSKKPRTSGFCIYDNLWILWIQFLLD